MDNIYYKKVYFPSNTLYWADVSPIEFLVGNIGQLSRLSPDSQPTVSKMQVFMLTSDNGPTSI
jgi:hypothetical protein